jgi:hypothetical protein
MNTCSGFDIICLCIGFVATIVGFAFWCKIRKPKPKPNVIICVKCKFCIEPTQPRCRLPDDPFRIDYVTGKVEYPSFSCHRYNSYGKCKHYQKVWWR